MSARKAVSRGFTLLEVMISLALVSLTFAMLLGSFSFVSKAWEKGLQSTEESSNYQIMQKMLQRLADRAFPVVVTEDNAAKYAFTGETDYLKIVHFSPAYPTRAGLYQTTLFIRQEEHLTNIYLQRKPYDSTSFFQRSRLSEKDDSLIYSSDHSLSFTYLASTTDDEADWLDEWSDTEQLPSLIRLNFSGDNNAPQKVPDIIVPIQITIDNHCVNPETEGKCRIKPETVL